MKRILIAAAALAALSLSALAAGKPDIKWPDYQFTTEIANPITSVKNQYRSGTCWAFSTIGFVESEVIRIGGITDTTKYPDLSEFFVVSNSYYDRAVKYVRLDGHMGFSAGSWADDVLQVIDAYGIVPNSAMTGMNYGTELPVQGELDKVLKAYVDAIVSNPNKTLSTAWKRGYRAVLDEYLGPCPATFEVDGVQYTPAGYRDALNFVPADYVSLTSFTHHPFYEPFVVEVPDNWRNGSCYNVPIDELIQILDYALEHGYTAAWGADVSEPGFTRDGYAILVDVKNLPKEGSDQQHWTGESGEQQSVDTIVERETSQQIRQTEYDNKTMTDDHGMQIFGIARDQWGKKYYMVKNSWGEAGKFDGIWYASEAFMRAQTLSLMIHKSAVPAEYVQAHKNIVD